MFAAALPVRFTLLLPVWLASRFSILAASVSVVVVVLVTAPRSRTVEAAPII
jgi:hypothetical protein